MIRRPPQPTATYAAVWPVEDQDMPIGDLLEEARADLAEMTRGVGHCVVGPIRWTTRDVADGVELFVTAPVAPITPSRKAA